MKIAIKKYDNMIQANIIACLFLLYFCAIYGHPHIEIFFAWGGSIIVSRAILLVLLAFTLVNFIVNIIKKKLFLNQYGFLLWYGLFIFYCGLSLLWTVNIQESIDLFNLLIENFAILFCIVFYVNTEERFLKVMTMHIVSICYASVRLIIFLPELRFFGRRSMILHIRDIVGDHYNILAINLAVGLMLILFFYYKTKKVRVLVPAFLVFYALLLAGSRAGVVVASLSILLFYVLLNGTKKMYKSLLILLVFITFAVLYLNSKLAGAEIIRSLIVGFLGGSSDFSFNERAFFREIAATMISQKPLIGNGLRSFTDFLADIMYRKRYTHAHNGYLDILASLGIVGFILYYSMYLRIFIAAVKNFASTHIYVVFSLVVCLAIFMYEFSESLFAIARLSSITVTFYAYYALKVYDTKKNQVGMPNGRID
ncbi:MAG: O-antigen ligase family protein [Lachnospiraceae bacterium]|nr:O-antigen ligase family protein [Lachnospiraceae bacterium]